MDKTKKSVKKFIFFNKGKLDRVKEIESPNTKDNIKITESANE